MRPGETERTETQSGRVLLVTADDGEASLLTASVTSLGPSWEVVRVAAPADGLQILEKRTFSTVLVDHSPPAVDGIDLLRQLRARGWTVPSILVTAYGSERLVADALGLGVSEYLRKEPGYLGERLPAAVLRTVTAYRKRLMGLSAMSRMRVQMVRKAHQGLLDGFAAPIVHDIRNPIFFIIGMAESLMGRLDDHHAVVTGLEKIIQKAEWMNQMVDRLLLFARQEAERRVSLDLAELIRALLERETAQLKLHNVRLVTSIEPGPIFVRAAPAAIEQVVLNLTSNAVEALINNHEGGEITVRLSRAEHGASLTVEDNGPGIPPEIAAQLFKPFYTFGKGRKGTGLGLSIAAGIVREHGGTIAVDSKPGQGTRFTVWLPLEEDRPLALVLEDDECIQDLVTSQLDSLGVRSEVHGDGVQILQRLMQGRWNLVILDVRTPTVGGIQVFREIIAHRPDLIERTMIVSGCIGDSALQDLIAAHPVPCLPKPYSIRDFSDVVRQLLRGAGPKDPGA